CAPHPGDDRIHTPVTWIVTLDVDYRAKAAGEGAAASSVERMHPAEEAFEIIGWILGQWRHFECGASPAVKRFRFAAYDICQNLMPNPFGLAMEEDHSQLHQFDALGGHDMRTRNVGVPVPVVKHCDGT